MSIDDRPADPGVDRQQPVVSNDGRFWHDGQTWQQMRTRPVVSDRVVRELLQLVLVFVVFPLTALTLVPVIVWGSLPVMILLVVSVGVLVRRIFRRQVPS